MSQTPPFPPAPTEAERPQGRLRAPTDWSVISNHPPTPEIARENEQQLVLHGTRTDTSVNTSTELLTQPLDNPPPYSSPDAPRRFPISLRSIGSSIWTASTTTVNKIRKVKSNLSLKHNKGKRLEDENRSLMEVRFYTWLMKHLEATIEYEFQDWSERRRASTPPGVVLTTGALHSMENEARMARTEVLYDEYTNAFRERLKQLLTKQWDGKKTHPKMFYANQPAAVYHEVFRDKKLGLRRIKLREIHTEADRFMKQHEGRFHFQLTGPERHAQQHHNQQIEFYPFMAKYEKRKVLTTSKLMKLEALENKLEYDTRTNFPVPQFLTQHGVV